MVRFLLRKALKEIKKTVSQSYAISGSWKIHMIPETVELNQLSYNSLSSGGIIATTNEEGTTQLELLADTKTGALLDLQAT